jgi:hypothetical protein
MLDLRQSEARESGSDQPHSALRDHHRDENRDDEEKESLQELHSTEYKRAVARSSAKKARAGPPKLV